MELIHSEKTLPDGIKRIVTDGSKKRIHVPELKQHALTICRKKIDPRYINNALKKYTYGYLYVKDNNIIGFAIWNVNYEILDIITSEVVEKSYIHVLLICSEKKEYKLGQIIAADIEKFCVKHDIQSIIIQPSDKELEAVYKMAGYSTECFEKIPCLFENQMTKLVSSSIHSIAAKTRRQRPRKKNTYKNSSINFNEILNNPNVDFTIHNYSLLNENESH